MKTLRSQVVTVTNDVDFGEGVVVLPDGRIAFVELAGSAVSVFDGTAVERIAKLRGGPNGLALSPDGALYVAKNGGIVPVWATKQWAVTDLAEGTVERVTFAGEVTEVTPDLPGPGPHRPNDLCFGPGGRLYFTDSGNWEAYFLEESDFRSSPPGYRPGGLWMQDPDGVVQQIAEVGDFANGIAVTPAGDAIVVTQTVLLQILVFPINPDGTVEAPDIYAHLPEPITPDGVCFADDGTLFAAGSGGNGIAVIAPDGVVTEVLETGAGSDPTNVALAPGKLWISFGMGRSLGYIEVDHSPLPLLS